MGERDHTHHFTISHQTGSIISRRHTDSQMLTNDHKAGRQTPESGLYLFLQTFGFVISLIMFVGGKRKSDAPLGHAAIFQHCDVIEQFTFSISFIRPYTIYRTCWLPGLPAWLCFVIENGVWWETSSDESNENARYVVRGITYTICIILYNVYIYRESAFDSIFVMFSPCLADASLRESQKCTNQPNLDREKYVSIVGFYTICVMVLWSTTGSQVLLLFIADIQTATSLTETTSQLRLMVNLMAFNGLSFSLLLSPFSWLWLTMTMMTEMMVSVAVFVIITHFA